MSREFQKTDQDIGLIQILFFMLKCLQILFYHTQLQEQQLQVIKKIAFGGTSIPFTNVSMFCYMNSNNNYNYRTAQLGNLVCYDGG